MCISSKVVPAAVAKFDVAGMESKLSLYAHDAYVPASAKEIPIEFPNSPGYFATKKFEVEFAVIELS